MSVYSEPIPEPCADFGLDLTALAQLKAITTSAGPSNLAKKIRVFNTANKRPRSDVSSPTAGENSVGNSQQSEGAIHSTTSSRSISPPSLNIFDDSDEGSVPVHAQKRSKKRKSPTKNEEDEEEEDSTELSAKRSKRDRDEDKRVVRKWNEPEEHEDLDTSTSYIKSVVDKHRALKRLADAAVNRSPPDYSALDHYLIASLGFFEAAALWELRARQKTSDEAMRDVANAIELYRGLAPSASTPTLLTYYIMQCEQAKYPLRIILAHRCLAMAYTRIYLLQRKALSHTLRTALKQGKASKTIEMETGKLADMNDILRFGDYYDQSEKAARANPQAFDPFPSHPFEIDPFDFLKFIREEHAKVDSIENISDDESGGEDADNYRSKGKGSSASSSSPRSSALASFAHGSSNGSNNHGSNNHKSNSNNNRNNRTSPNSSKSHSNDHSNNHSKKPSNHSQSRRK